jgi:hypothetical protein
MRRLPAALLLTLTVLLPAAADDKKADDKKADKEATDKLISAGTITGKVAHVEADKKAFTVSVPIKVQVPNVGAMQQLANLQAQLATTRDPNQIRSLAQQIAQQQANLTTIKEEWKPIDVVADEDSKVRVRELPPAIDAKTGKPRPYTSAELKELKGKDKEAKLPGYVSDFDHLHTDQVVTVTLMQKKEALKKVAKTEEEAKQLAETYKPLATLIVIEGEPPAK